MLDTGIPNLYPTPVPLLFNASSTDPLLGAGAAGPAASDPAPCPSTLPTCVLTAQYNNSRTGGTAETVFETSNLAGNLQLLAQFQVNTSGLPPNTPPFTNNPVYAQPLYVSGLGSIGNPPATHNVVFVTTLNGEVYASMRTTPQLPPSCGTEMKPTRHPASRG